MAEAETQRLRILERLNEYDQAIARAFAEQQQSLKNTEFDPVRADSFSGYLWRLKQLRSQEHQILQKQEQVVIKARKALQEALIKKKSLEVLKDKEHQRFLRHIDKLDEDFLNEIALNQYTRNLQH